MSGKKKRKGVRVKGCLRVPIRVTGIPNTGPWVSAKVGEECQDMG